MTKKYLIALGILSAIVMLSGCSTPKKINTTQNVPDRRTIELIENDTDIQARIKSDLHDDDEIRKWSHINVNVFNGAVLLTGEAMSEGIKSKIIDMARVVPHVTMIHDYLSVDYLSDNLSRANDRRITQSIRQALSQIRLTNFDASLVKVITEQSTVYLMGRVNREEGTRVINIVRLEPDIRQIVTVFEYMD